MNAEASDPDVPRARNSLGVTFIEILMAVVILAMALIPVFGLITQGLINTEVSVTYTTGAKICQSVMNHLLSNEIPFESLPLTNPPPAGGMAVYPARGAAAAPAGGNVVLDSTLDGIFPTPDWTSDTTTGTRSKEENGVRFHVQVWVGNYSQDDDIVFNWFETPEVDWQRGATPIQFARTLVTSSSDFTAGFSPYHTTTPPAQLIAGTPPWAVTLVTRNQEALSEQVGTPATFRNFAKIVVRTSWIRRSKKDGRWNEFYLVSFRANREG